MRRFMHLGHLILFTPNSAGGHGIGKTFHANPYVLHHKNDVNNGVMALGHTFTIEPLICEGTGETTAVLRLRFA